jgi:hypothetical protein
MRPAELGSQFQRLKEEQYRSSKRIERLMTELEMSLTLGMMCEPEKNRVQIDPVIQAEIMFLKHIFSITRIQRTEVGRINPDVWAELLPWHSMN